MPNKFAALKNALDERVTRLWAGAEAEAIGYEGIKLVAQATGLAISTVTKGRNELRAGASAVVATGLGGYHFHRFHRYPGDHPVISARFFA